MGECQAGFLSLCRMRPGVSWLEASTRKSENRHRPKRPLPLNRREGKCSKKGFRVMKVSGYPVQFRRSRAPAGSHLTTCNRSEAVKKLKNSPKPVQAPLGIKDLREWISEIFNFV